MTIGNSLTKKWLHIAAAGMAVCALSIATAQPVFAQDPKPADPKPADAPAPAPDPDKVTLNFFKGTEVGGLVDTYYEWYTTKANGAYRAFDQKHNTFDVSMAEIWLAKAPASDSPIGYKVRLNFGSAPTVFTPGTDSDYKNIEEAYGSYLAPVGKGLQIDIGKFVTNAGAEVVEAKDNWNYSRSLLFQLAIPVYHAGIRLTYSPNDKVTLMGGVVNGWNDVADNNTGKTVMASITLKPTGAVTIIENYIGGPEQPNDSTDWRTPVRHGRQLHGDADGEPDGQLRLRPRHGRPAWSTPGRASPATRSIQANKWVAVVPRVEYYNDANGWSTGTVQNLTEGTITLEVKAADNFLWRTSIAATSRTSRRSWTARAQPKKNQQSLTFGFLYSFSSKS